MLPSPSQHDLAPADVPSGFEIGLQICQYLAGVVVVRQSIDDRHTGVRGKLLRRRRARNVLIMTMSTIEEMTRALSAYGLAPPQLRVLTREKQRAAA